MKIFLYLNDETFFHKLDPRTKIIGLLLLSGLLFSFNDPLFLAGIFGGLLILSFMAKITKHVVRFSPILISLALISTLTWPFYLKEGQVLLSLGPIEITQGALVYGIAMGVRWASAILIGLIFISTTKPDDFYAGLVLFRLPASAAFVVSLTFRLVPMLIGTGLGIIESQTSRGLDLSSGTLLARFRKVMALVVPLMMHAVRQNDLISTALESRGFSPKNTRSFYREYRLQLYDYSVIFVLGLLFLGALFLHTQGIGVNLTNRL